MNKIPATKTENEEIVYRWCYGKFIKCGTIKTEEDKKKPQTN